jgi:hypothetical protein
VPGTGASTGAGAVVGASTGAVGAAGSTGVPVGGSVPPPEGDPVAGAGVEGMVGSPVAGAGVEGVISSFLPPFISSFGAVSPAGIAAPPGVLLCWQREFNGDRSQRIFMIAGDKGFSAEGSLVCAELRALMVVKTNPAAIKLKIVFAVVFIGNVPNSSCEMFLQYSSFTSVG